jgi:hypothetical protein
MSLVPPPSPPTTADSTNFSTRMDAFLAWLLASLVPYLQALSLSGATAPADNIAINGAMEFDQENSGSSVTLTAAAAIKYVLDQFYASCTGANITTQRIAGTGAYRNTLRFTGAASNTALLFGQRHESYDCDDMLSSNVTHQWELSSNSLTVITWNAYYANAQDDFSAKTLIATGSFTINSTPAVYSATFNAGASARNGICVELVGGALLSGKTLDISGYKLEVGNAATAFKSEKRTTAFARCLRHFFYNGTAGNVTIFMVGTIYTTSTASGGFPFPVAMRAIPATAIVGTLGIGSAGLTGTVTINLNRSTPFLASFVFASTLDAIFQAICRY